MTTNTAINYRIKEQDKKSLERVTGGTFTPNTHSKSEYHAIGISTRYHLLDSDEFMFMGSKISYDQANDLVSIARNCSSCINEGYDGANQISYSEKAFIAVFNSQIFPKYHVKWDGIPGHDY